MGWAKQQYHEFLQTQSEASYEEAQSRLRMSTLCKDLVRPLPYPLPARIVELGHLLLKADEESGRVGEEIYVHETVSGVVYSRPVHSHGLFVAVVAAEASDHVV